MGLKDSSKPKSLEHWLEVSLNCQISRTLGLKVVQTQIPVTVELEARPNPPTLWSGLLEYIHGGTFPPPSPLRHGRLLPRKRPQRDLTVFFIIFEGFGECQNSDAGGLVLPFMVS